LIADKRANAVAVVFTNRERVTFSKTYGPVDFDRSIWRAASVSKALTAIAVMRLAEEGRVDLDGDVNRYLKTFKIPATFQQPITLRQLLEHRSGLDDRFIGDGFRIGEQPPMRLLMQQVLPERVYAPSNVEFYSNYGYGLIGAVLEDVTGERFEDYICTTTSATPSLTRCSRKMVVPACDTSWRCGNHGSRHSRISNCDTARGCRRDFWRVLQSDDDSTDHEFRIDPSSRILDWQRPRSATDRRQR